MLEKAIKNKRSYSVNIDYNKLAEHVVLELKKLQEDKDNEQDVD